MIITEIKEIGKGKYKITRDDDIYLTLYYREMKGLSFRVEEEAGEEQWAIGLKSVIARGKKRVFHLLAKKDYTEHEIITKLSREHYHETQIHVILGYFRELGYIDDSCYVRKYYNVYKTSRSRRIIEQKLSQKGIGRQLIKETIDEEAGDEDAYKAAKGHAEKKYGRKDVTGEDYPKMIQFLMRRGFDYNLSRQVIQELMNSREEMDDIDSQY